MQKLWQLPRRKHKYKRTIGFASRHGQRRYIYYHCTQSRNFDCSQPYLRVEKLKEAFLRLLANITIEEVENNEALQAVMDRFRRLSAAVLGNTENDGQGINLHNFAKYILTEGTRAEKRALISCLEQTIYLKNKEVTTEI
jgi:hypothetical protein